MFKSLTRVRCCVKPSFPHLDRRMSYSTEDGQDIILRERVDSVGYIRLNRRKSLNSFNIPLFHDLTRCLNEYNDDNRIKITVITGTGKYFTSGNDQNNLKLWMNKPEDEADAGLKYFIDSCDETIKSLIEFKKPLILAANGPGIGVGLTILGLVDYAICSDQSWFWAPFSQIGICPEFCSSYTFPKMIGTSRSTSCLMFGHKVSAEDALKWGLVSKIVPHDSLQDYLRDDLIQGLLDKTIIDSYADIKGLMRDEDEKRKLHRVRENELKLLSMKFKSPEAIDFARKFLEKSNKS